MTIQVKPILKWAGGKRQLISSLTPLIPSEFDLYCEPFLGGGAFAFALKPTHAIVSDINSDLINLYTVVRNNLDDLLKELSSYKNTEEFFYKVRSLDRDTKVYSKLTSIKKAARTYFLNRTCFNGLYRVNSKGQFNSPYGHYKKDFVVDVEALSALSMYLNTSEIDVFNESYEVILKRLPANTFVYLDPPYDPIPPTSTFTSYSKLGFSKQDQTNLRDLCDDLTARNIKFMLSNSATDFIKSLYKDYDIKIVQARRNVNSKGSARGPVNEVIIRNYTN